MSIEEEFKEMMEKAGFKEELEYYKEAFQFQDSNLNPEQVEDIKNKLSLLFRDLFMKGFDDMKYISSELAILKGPCKDGRDLVQRQVECAMSIIMKFYIDGKIKLMEQANDDKMDTT